MQSLNPSPYIYKAQYDFNWESIKDKVYERVDIAEEEIKSRQLLTPEKNGGITTAIIRKYDPPHNWDEFDLFKPWLYERINMLWDEWRLQPMNKHLSDSWINCHPPGAWTAEHYHQSVVVAVSAYLHVPENSGRFLIKNPLLPYKTGEPLWESFFDEHLDWIPVEVKTNDVLFFPGWLSHKTEQNMSDLNRYVMTLNVMGKFI